MLNEAFNQIKMAVQRSFRDAAYIDFAYARLSPKAKRRTGLEETGLLAAEKYRHKHPARASSPNSLRKLERERRIAYGLRPLRYPTPTRREMTIARKEAARARSL
jgi:hypothetical protein